MILQLDSEHRILGTAMCWELQSPRMSKGKREWRPYKYFPTLGDALREAAHAEIRTAPVEGIAEGLKTVDAVIRKYSEIIDGAADQIAEQARRVAA